MWTSSGSDIWMQKEKERTVKELIIALAHRETFYVLFVSYVWIWKVFNSIVGSAFHH